MQSSQTRFLICEGYNVTCLKVKRTMDLAPHGEMLQNSLCLSPQGSGTSIGTGSSDSKANELVSESRVEKGKKIRFRRRP